VLSTGPLFRFDVLAPDRPQGADVLRSVDSTFSEALPYVLGRHMFCYVIPITIRRGAYRYVKGSAGTIKD